MTRRTRNDFFWGCFAVASLVLMFVGIFTHDAFWMAFAAFQAVFALMCDVDRLGDLVRGREVHQHFNVTVNGTVSDEELADLRRRVGGAE